MQPDNYGPQFRTFTMRQVSRMTSGDYGAPMSELGQYRDVMTAYHSGNKRVSETADDIRAGADIPPIQVVAGRAAPIVNDGHHRFLAHQEAGKVKIRARIPAGDYAHVMNQVGRYTPPEER